MAAAAATARSAATPAWPPATTPATAPMAGTRRRRAPNEEEEGAGAAAAGAARDGDGAPPPAKRAATDFTDLLRRRWQSMRDRLASTVFALVGSPAPAVAPVPRPAAEDDGREATPAAAAAPPPVPAPGTARRPSPAWSPITPVAAWRAEPALPAWTFSPFAVSAWANEPPAASSPPPWLGATSTASPGPAARASATAAEAASRRTADLAAATAALLAKMKARASPDVIRPRPRAAEPPAVPAEAEATTAVDAVLDRWRTVGVAEAAPSARLDGAAEPAAPATRTPVPPARAHTPEVEVTFVSPPSVHRRSATEKELLNHIEQLGEIGKHVRDALEGRPLPQLPMLEKYAELAQERQDRLEQAAKKIGDLDLKSKEKEVVVDNFPALTAEQNAKVNRLLSSSFSGEVCTIANITVHADDIARLQDTEWLNDELVNAYMKLIAERSAQPPTPENPTPFPSVHVFSTFFYEKIIRDDFVPSWTRRVGVDIFAKDLVIVPVHLGVHWCMCIINMRRKRIEYYDSLRGDNVECFQSVRSYLRAEHKAKKNAELDLSGWVDYCPKDIPTQKNGYDCGVFACMFAEFLSRNHPLVFSQADMPYLRRRMVCELAEKRLLVQRVLPKPPETH